MNYSDTHIRHDQYYADAYQPLGFLSTKELRTYMFSLDIKRADQSTRFQLKDSNYYEDTDEGMRKSTVLFNAARWGGWIPGVGVVTGACKVYAGMLLALEREPKMGAVYVVRGLVEAVGAGILFAPVDAGVTALRKRNPIQVTDPLASRP